MTLPLHNYPLCTSSTTHFCHKSSSARRRKDRSISLGCVNRVGGDGTLLTNALSETDAYSGIGRGRTVPIRKATFRTQPPVVDSAFDL
jgi:hypothetical protein